jgi:hypothetical protein
MINVVPAISLTWEFDFNPTTGAGVPAPQYAFGVRTDDATFWFKFGVSPTQWERIGQGTGGGGGGTTQVFEYTVTGAEPDLSEITITLPTAMASTLYAVTWSCQGCAGIVGIDITAKTTTQFVAVATGKLTAGDVLAFFAAPLT